MLPSMFPLTTFYSFIHRNSYFTCFLLNHWLVRTNGRLDYQSLQHTYTPTYPKSASDHSRQFLGLVFQQALVQSHHHGFYSETRKHSRQCQDSRGNVAMHLEILGSRIETGV